MESKNTYDVAVIGGGLAGLSAAITLAQRGARVVLFEKKEYPRHKVCGEYVSNEVLPVLNQFGIDPFASGAVRINRFVLSAPSGQSVESKLPLGAFGISRFALDELLFNRAKEMGVDVYTRHKVNQIEFIDPYTRIVAGDVKVNATFAVGAFGKTSNIKAPKGSPKGKYHGKYIGVKRHVKLDFREDLVELHNFDGGYCGVSRVEGNRVNLCYLARARDVQKAGSIAAFEKQVMWRNPLLRKVLQTSEELFPQPLAISNFSFGAKQPVVNHLFMAGDAAGMISPLCGNGMAMAISSGFQLGQILIDGLNGKISITLAEQEYTRYWKSNFEVRMWWGNRLQPLFGRPVISNLSLRVLNMMPFVLPAIIEKTHGEPIPA